MSDLDHAKSLLDMAKADLNALRGMMSSGLPSFQELFSDEIFGFHAHQSAEKCLKSWIASRGKRYPRTHDLMALIETLNDIEEDTSDLESLVDLNPFAIQYRYESLDKDDEVLDRALLLSEVESLFRRVANQVKD